MANKKITDLTELAEAPATGDLAVIVDISDTTDAATGTNKKITATNLLALRTDQDVKTTSNPSFGGTLVNTALTLTSTDSVVNLEMLDDTTTQNIAIQRNSDDLFILPNGGNVAIGTNSANAKLEIEDDGTNICTFIDMNGDNQGLFIDSEATTNSEGTAGLRVYTGQGASAAVFEYASNATGQTWLVQNPNGGNVASNHFFRNTDSTGTDCPVVLIEQDNSGDDQNALSIQQDGTGAGIFIDQNGEGIAIDIDSEATGSTQGIRLNMNAGTAFMELGGVNSSNATYYFFRNTTSASTQSPVALIKQDNASDDQPALQIQQDGTGNGIFIDQNGESEALKINYSGTTTSMINMRQDDSSVIMTLGQGNVSIGTFRFYRNLSSATTQSEVMSIVQDNSGDDQPALSIQNDGTGPCQLFTQAQDVEVIDFDGCTDGGTGNTTIATSVKVQMPNGATGYINLYT